MNRLVGIEARNNWKESEKLVWEIIEEILEWYKDLVFSIVSEWTWEQMKWEKWWDIDIKVNLFHKEVKHDINIQVKHWRKSPKKIKSYEEWKWIYMIDWVNEKTREELKYFISLMFLNYLNKYNLHFWKMYK